ncbi:MAG: low specificity L-threonine aldolase [Candidatus Omnitrophota bacterium]|jgi:threonine aldolase|nr:MAG: low specificity L-threonine aldolase [Candidatus Omnitrophota bacterium]
MKIRTSFASDNNSGVHPEALQAICAANDGHTIAYGNDPYTETAIEKLKEHFGKSIDAYFVFAGTAANVLGLRQAADTFHSVLCADSAHIYVDECGAPEQYIGCKLLPIHSRDGKVSVEGIQKHLHGIGFEHHSQPRVVSITQATEYGTVYSPEEIKTIADFVHERDMVLHMDGARLSNAAASLGVNLRQTSADVGVDILSFGGTKNGLMFGECILFFNKKLSQHFKYIRKQGMQLYSKMRYIAAQYISFLTDDLWLRNARHANEMALLLAEEVEKIPKIIITQKVQANAVFAIVPAEAIPLLQKKYFFYVWNEKTSEVRWMTSFDTQEEDVRDFVDFMRQIVK